MIDKDLTQHIDEGENQDGAMKKDLRSINVLVTAHTNDETQEDEGGQTRSKKASRVVTPAVTGETYCKGSDRGQIRPFYQLDANPTRDMKDKIVHKSV